MDHNNTNPSAGPVRMGIIGLGNMGSFYARQFAEHEIPGAVIGAVCDVRPDRIPGEIDIPYYSDHIRMMESGAVDAVIVTTPHTSHPDICIEAFRRGLHVLVEKPLAVTKSQAARVNAAYEGTAESGLVFGIMFNQRCIGYYSRLKSLIEGGELGRIQRFQWTVTDWFRPECYYRSGGWRATWEGEGGGVLMNQSPHQIDMIQWLFGMPERVHAFGGLGKYHSIEVEDEVSAYMEFPGGGSGLFITSTGEAPGSNRLEIAADRGRVIVENGTIERLQNETDTSMFSRTSEDPFSAPANRRVSVPFEKSDEEEHAAVIRRFAEAVSGGSGNAGLAAHGTEGIRQVELTNAMILSLISGSTVELPLSADAYDGMLDGLIAESRGRGKRRASA